MTDGVDSRPCGNEVVVLRGNEVVVLRGNKVYWSVWTVFPFSVFVKFPHARELWIPAFAGMTEYFFGR